MSHVWTVRDAYVTVTVPGHGCSVSRGLQGVRAAKTFGSRVCDTSVTVTVPGRIESGQSPEWTAPEGTR
jgi:hypothetical protein